MPNTLKDLERALANLPKIVNTAKKTALTSAMFHLQQSTKEWIETGGQGTWEEKASLSKRLTKFQRGEKKGDWRRASSKQRKQKPLARLAKYPRYIVKKDGSNARLGFAIKPRPKRFSKLLGKTISEVQENRTYTVDKQTQIALASSKKALAKSKQKKAVSGKDFFAANEGATIEVPAYPIIEPVAKKELPRAVEIYNKRLTKRLEKERQKGNLPFGKFK